MVKMVEKEASAGDAVKVRENQVAVTGVTGVHVESHVFELRPKASAIHSETFTRGVFEDALDKASRPVKGKYADMLPSSEEFIEDKRREIELEDRLS